ncbi:hypothetical protein DEO23_08640 [Brachybacterium endophyticum]|uniref:SAF domain-containing protein n=1 Tax=Brachybacterium endophyticum TaxID=2182385 RepID=A0A2U2RM52_9MICO|nr:SAF domain-containing protein [Brachybacterium endophyticum]PWH06950.1 hypothetical protein DEO23_08640 [Brachybacterium endophyticum]
MLRRLHASLPHWHRAVRRRRRLLSVLLAAVMIALLAPGLLPASAHTRSVVVAARDLDAGTVLDSQDLRSVEVSEALAPEDSTSTTEDLKGMRLSTALGKGTVLAPGRLRADSEAPDLTGLAVIAVPVEPALVPRLGIGDSLALITSTEAPGRTRRIDATVVEVPESSAGSRALGGTPQVGGQDVLVAIDTDETGDVAQAVREGWLQSALVF